MLFQLFPIFRHAFNFLLQYIYGFNLDYEISVDQLFEILNLAERWEIYEYTPAICILNVSSSPLDYYLILTFRYDIAALREHITTKLAELSVIEEEVVEVSSNYFASIHLSYIRSCKKSGSLGNICV